jgi:transposase
MASSLLNEASPQCLDRCSKVTRESGLGGVAPEKRSSELSAPTGTVSVPSTREPEVDISVVLNRCHRFPKFVYGKNCFAGDRLDVEVHPRKGSKPVCSGCNEPGPIYDTMRKPRGFEFVPLWGYVVFLWYVMRRVDCRRCGVTVERVPWADGKSPTCNAYRLFLSRWAKRLSWSEVAEIFGTNWGVVYRSVQWAVAHGLAHRTLGKVLAIGIDEIAVWAGHKYLTVVYQIDAGRRRLLLLGSDPDDGNNVRIEPAA